MIALDMSLLPWEILFVIIPHFVYTFLISSEDRLPNQYYFFGSATWFEWSVELH